MVDYRMRGSVIRAHAGAWDKQFTHRVHSLRPEEADIRIANAFLAGYDYAMSRVKTRRRRTKLTR